MKWLECRLLAREYKEPVNDADSAVSCDSKETGPRGGARPAGVM